MAQKSKKTTGFRMPHVFIILLLIMLFVVVLSYIIPSGTYERLENAAGITVIDPDTFHYVENDTPITFMNYFEAVYNGFVNGATIMGTLFICSGVIYLLEASGAFGAFIGVILDRTKGKEFSVVCIFYTIFVIFGVLGYGEAAYPFYPLAVTIGFALGYDRMVGTALAIVGSTVGFTSGLMNTFTTGVAQQIVGLPLFSGIGFRAAGLAVFYVIGLAGLYAYCRKIRRDPLLSLLSDEYTNLRKEDHTDGLEEMNIRRVLGLLAFLGVIVVQGYGCIRLGWSFPQIGAILVAHPVHAMAFAVTDTEFDARTIPESYILLRDVKTLPYEELYLHPDQVATEFDAAHPVVLVENDSVIVTGSSLLQAFDRLEVMELTANSILESQSLGSIVHIRDEEIDDLKTAFHLEG